MIVRVPTERKRAHLAQVTAFLVLFLFSAVCGTAQTPAGWPFAGFDLNNSRWASQETSLSITNVGMLRQQWTLTTQNDVSATPSVDSSGNVYFPDWSGNLWKLNAATGAVIWHQTMSGCGLPPGAISRTTPTLAGNYVLVGASAPLGTAGTTSAFLVALDPATGNKLWQLQLDPSSWAVSTGSPIVYNNVVYVGVSSGQEVLFHPNFRGSLLAVSLSTGQILWRTYTVPPGYTGGPIWSSTPVIDVARNQIYITTGNNYLVPASVEQCEEQAGGNNAAILACQSPSNYEDSIVALNLTNGAIVWGRKCSVDDAFLTICHHGGPACPDPAGQDYDFGDGAHLFTANINGVPTDLVGAGQKSGKFWALNPSTGAVVWKTAVGPGGLVGGIQWGSASDGQRVYVAEANTAHEGYLLEPWGTPWDGGSWAALDAATGQFIWQIGDPGRDPVHPGFPSMALGPVTVANGVLYCASMSGMMYALNAATGQPLWSFQAAGSVNAAPAVVNGWVYWGSGYSNFRPGNPIGTPSNTFYAFAVPSTP
jgi:polyvinyl alcohol dehydrogenase (cytochrome)